MINSLRGTITYKGSTEIHLENRDVEWRLTVSERTARDLPAVGNEARVYTHLHHRDDQMVLFGFARVEERFLFHDLLRVSGIGPKQAIRILSGMSVDEFVKSLDSDDVDSLSRIPGLGRKTAQKIILTLRGRLTVQQEDEGEAKPFAEIVSALADMGFDRPSAARIVSSLIPEISAEFEDPASREKEIFRRAIVALSSNQ
ncbi:MAG: Holliday junction branch migration protein RuvA [Spirochaetales bacterium]|nr:Holliday junction branch migration protein RuvA [Spirochaetales bacterium]